MMGFLSLAMVLLSLALFIAWLVAWPTFRAWRALVEAPSRASLARFNVIVLAIPLLAGVVIALGAVWPSHDLFSTTWSCHCDPSSPFAPIHLCFLHPSSSLALMPMAVFLVVWLGWRPTKLLTRVGRRLKEGRRLLRSARDGEREGDVRLVELGSTNACTVGLFDPVVLADASWWSSLGADAKRIVEAHEQAHVRCMDPLTYTVAQLFAALAPLRDAERLVEGWLGWAETRADAHAAATLGDSERVAALLVDQARCAAAPSLIPAFGATLLERRVGALLDPPARQPALRSDLRLGLPLAAAASVVFLVLFGFGIHHLIEALLSQLAI